MLNWKEAKEAVESGKKVLFHHRGKAVEVDKNTDFQDLQWKHFGTFGLTWNDILNGQYTLMKG